MYDAAAQSVSSPRGYYLRLSRQAMACHFELFLRPQDQPFLSVALESLAEVDALEQQMTIYRDDSELSTLNRAAHEKPVPVEARLYQLLIQAREIGRETGGAYDITAGPLVRCWGFLNRNGRVPEPDDLQAARRLTGWDALTFHDATRSISFRKPGMELNLGSIGKGYALDRLAEGLRKKGLRNFLIHAGHSSILAAGDSNSGPGWDVSLRDPRTQESLGTLKLKDQGMSTSGVGQQSFVANGKRYGHLLDPRSGWPGTATLLCSVVAPAAARAEALSTAFFVMRLDEIQRYCEGHPEVGTLVMPAEAENGPTEMTLFGIELEQPEVVT
jgi:thiamine biosynthesis lipoprotein